MKRLLLLPFLLLFACPQKEPAKTPKPIEASQPADPDANDSQPSASTTSPEPSPQPTVSEKKGAPTTADLAAHPEWFACSKDADCVMTKMSCCDYCVGENSSMLAVNAKFKGEAFSSWGKSCGKGVICSVEADCDEPSAACVNKVCTPKIGGAAYDNPIQKSSKPR